MQQRVRNQANFFSAVTFGIVTAAPLAVELETARLGLTASATEGVSVSRALIPRTFETLVPGGGRLGGFSTTQRLAPGTLVDRFGPNTGRWVSPAGTPFSARGLPPEAVLERFQTFEVLQPLNVEGSVASPAFGGGLGVQYRLPAPVRELIDAGILGVK